MNSCTFRFRSCLPSGRSSKWGCTNKKVPTWNPDCEQVVVTEALVRILPAGGIPVAGHGLDHHDGQGEVCLHRFLIVMDRLAPLGGVFRSESFLFVFLKAIKLILGNFARILSWVADRVLVAEVCLLEAFFNSTDL